MSLEIMQYLLYVTEEIFVEPSAAISLLGPGNALFGGVDKAYLRHHNLVEKEENIIHICWLTGGSLVPNENREVMVEKAKKEYLRIVETN